MAEEAKWYVAHTYSGYENTVKATIEKAVENRNMGDLILAVNIPLETVTEITDTGCTVKNVKTGESTFVACDNVVNGVGFIPTPVGGKDNKQVHRVGDCVAIGNLRTVIWRAWDVCMKI